MNCGCSEPAYDAEVMFSRIEQSVKTLAGRNSRLWCWILITRKSSMTAKALRTKRVTAEPEREI